MATRLDYGWRWFATGMSFVVFGIVSASFSVVLFLFCWLWPARRARQRAVTAVIHWFFRGLVMVLQWGGVMSLDVSGYAALRSKKTGIVVANHPTYLDVIVLLALIPRACCVVKYVHWRNPCFWGIVRAAEYVSNADPIALVNESVERIANGYTMIVFPEGSRSPQHNDGHPDIHPFARGFAHIALKSMAPVVPVFIQCDPPAFTKRMRWYDVPVKPFCMRIEVIDAVDGQSLFPPGDVSSAYTARTLTTFVETTFRQHLVEYGFSKT